MNILESLKIKRRATTQAAADSWAKLVKQVATDVKMNVDVVDKKLTEFGKTDDDLASAVALFLRVQAAKTIVRGEVDHAAEMIENAAETLRIEADADAAIGKIRAEARHAADQLLTKSALLIGQENKIADARSFLLSQPKSPADVAEILILEQRVADARENLARITSAFHSGNANRALTLAERTRLKTQMAGLDAEISSLNSDIGISEWKALLG